MSLKGNVALVTGASRGIGRAIAEELASRGADVAAIYAGRREAAEAVCADIVEKYGVRAKAYQLDVADFNACGEVVKAVNADFGQIDILVNNAGVNRDGLIMRMKEADFDVVLDTNLKGTFNMIRHVSGLMMRRRSGRIINISSVAGLMGNAGQTNYAASKAGVVGLTKSAARELAPRGVLVNAIAPGFIATDMTKEFDGENPLVQSVPLKRMGAPEDIAQAAAFLAGEGAKYITGVVLRVDGGMAM